MDPSDQRKDTQEKKNEGREGYVREEGERGEAVASVGAASASLALVRLWSRLACWVGRLACLADAAFKKTTTKEAKQIKTHFYIGI